MRIYSADVMRDYCTEIKEKYIGKKVVREYKGGYTDFYVSNQNLYKYRYSGIINYETERLNEVHCFFDIWLDNFVIKDMEIEKTEVITDCDIKYSYSKRIPTPKKAYRMLGEVLSFITEKGGGDNA